MQKNYKAFNALYCALDGNEFNIISACELTTEVWNTLVTIYEGTSEFI